MFGSRMPNQPFTAIDWEMSSLHFVLFGFSANLALHLERSPWHHGYGYAPAGDRPGCCASFILIPESLMQYAG